MIENKESSYTVKGFFVGTIFFTEKSLLRYFNQLVCFNQNSASKSGNNGMFSVYCYCGDRYFIFFSANFTDSLMVYICGKFEPPNCRSTVGIMTSSFSPKIQFNDDVIFAVMWSSKSRKMTFSNFNEDTDPSLELYNLRTAWPISVIHISFFSIWKALSCDINS